MEIVQNGDIFVGRDCSKWRHFLQKTNTWIGFTHDTEYKKVLRKQILGSVSYFLISNEHLY